MTSLQFHSTFIVHSCFLSSFTLKCMFEMGSLELDTPRRLWSSTNVITLNEQVIMAMISSGSIAAPMLQIRKQGKCDALLPFKNVTCKCTIRTLYHLSAFMVLYFSWVVVEYWSSIQCRSDESSGLEIALDATVPWTTMCFIEVCYLCPAAAEGSQLALFEYNEHKSNKTTSSQISPFQSLNRYISTVLK